MKLVVWKIIYGVKFCTEVWSLLKNGVFAIFGESGRIIWAVGRSKWGYPRRTPRVKFNHELNPGIYRKFWKKVWNQKSGCGRYDGRIGIFENTGKTGKLSGKIPPCWWAKNRKNPRLEWTLCGKLARKFTAKRRKNYEEKVFSQKKFERNFETCGKWWKIVI